MTRRWKNYVGALVMIMFVLTGIVSGTGAATDTAAVHSDVVKTTPTVEQRAEMAQPRTSVEIIRTAGLSRDERSRDITHNNLDYMPITQTDNNISVSDNNPQSAGAYLAAFRKLEESNAYTSYSEFEVIRSQAVFAVQIGEFSTAEQARMRLVLDLLQIFATAYERQQAGEYEAAIQAAENGTVITEQLRSTIGGGRYAALAGVAIDRFYADTGQELQSRAETVSATETRIEALEDAARAYQQAGSTDRYAQILVRADRLRQTFQRDRDELNASVASARTFISACSNCGGAGEAINAYGAGVFQQYRSATRAVNDANQAVEIAEKHEMTERLETVQSARSAAGQRRDTLAVASTVLILGYSTFTGIIVGIIGWRVALWQRDLTAATRGDSLLLGAMLRG